MQESPLHIQYDTEGACDAGGVLRDMLSAFWEAVYLSLFDGGSVLTPLLHAQVEMSTAGKDFVPQVIHSCLPYTAHCISNSCYHASES